MFVYLIGNVDEGFCKIGISHSPEYRVYILDSPKLPFPLHILAKYDAGDNAQEVEQKLHTFYKSRRVRGEWFSYIRPTAFALIAEVMHSGCKTKTLLKAIKARRDPRVVWAEEWAFGQRMLSLTEKLERKTL
jgi:hypothetical protein